MREKKNPGPFKICFHIRHIKAIFPFAHATAKAKFHERCPWSLLVSVTFHHQGTARDARFEPWRVTKETNKDLHTALKMNQMWGDPSCLVSPVPSCLGVVCMQLTDVNCQDLERRGLKADFSSRIQFLSSVVYNWAVFHHIHFIKISVTRGLLSDRVRIFHCKALQSFPPSWLSFLLLQYCTWDNFALEMIFFSKKGNRDPWPAWAGWDFKNFLFVPFFSPLIFTL